MEPCSDWNLVPLIAKLGHTFEHVDLLKQALTHSTWANECRDGSPSYERLEFLGDAVLQLLVSEHLYQLLPKASEGALSRRRAQLVREPTLAALALRLGVAAYVRVGGSQEADAIPKSILADIMEAILAAVYLDGGLVAARQVLGPWLAHLSSEGGRHIDHKTQLQEACHQMQLGAPTYTVVAAEGPAHARQYKVALNVGTDVITTGVGTSKKSAEQLCASRALTALGLLQQS